MSRFMRYALACALFVTLAGSALASPVFFQMTRQYQDMGAGPLAVGAVGFPLQYQIGDAQPQSTSVGFYLQPSSPLVQIPAGAHVWAEAAGSTTGGAVVYPGSFGGIPPNPPITIGQGGTSASNAIDARANLGLGALSLLGTIDLGGANATGTLAGARFPAMTGDCATTAGSLVITCGSTGGVAFGALATQSSVNLGSQATGTLQAAQAPALSGAITTTAGSLATTISSGAVTAAKMASGAAVGNLGFTPPNPANAMSEYAGTAAASRANLGAAASGANSDITSILGLAVPLSVSQGGTGGHDAASARAGIGAAASGSNSDITQILGLTAPLSVSQGGSSNANGVLGNAIFPANNYGSCTWTSAGDVGPCINAAISAAAANPGGGTVVLPSSQGVSGTCFGVATPILQQNSGVSLIGQGVGNPRDTIIPGRYLAGTRLCWNGAAGATMFTESPSGNIRLYSASVENTVFDCNNIAGICAKISSLTQSILRFGVAEPTSIGAWFTTSPITDTQDSQDNDIWVWSRSTSNVYAPTGILFDANSGSGGNFSYNRINLAYAWYNNGDGIVLANGDNNIFMDLRTYSQGGAGRSFVCANASYVAPNGVPTSSRPCEDNVVIHNGTFANVLGWATGATFVANPSNSCNGGGVTACGNITVGVTTAGGSRDSSTIVLASNTGLANYEIINCPANSGVPTDAQIVAITGSTQIALATNALFNNIANGLSCTVSWGPTYNASTTTYTITATGASTYSITSTTGHNQTGISPSGGTLAFTDIVAPWSAGLSTIGDSWTVTLPAPARSMIFNITDNNNVLPDPAVQAGVNIMTFGRTNWPLPRYGSYNNTPPTLLLGNVGGSGQGCVGIGGNASNCFGNGGAIIAAVGGSELGFGGVVLGHNGVSGSGNAYGVVRGENATAGGALSEVSGEQGADFSRFNIQVHGGGAINSVSANGQGSAQSAGAVLWATGAGGTTVRLTADGAAAGSANCLNVVNNYTAYGFTNTITLQQQGAANAESWIGWAMQLRRGASASTTSLDAATTPTPLNSSVGGSVSASVDTTNSCLNMSITLPASGTWTVVDAIVDAEGH